MRGRGRDKGRGRGRATARARARPPRPAIPLNGYNCSYAPCVSHPLPRQPSPPKLVSVYSDLIYDKNLPSSSWPLTPALALVLVLALALALTLALALALTLALALAVKWSGRGEG